VSASGDIREPPETLAPTRARIAYLSELFIAPEFNWFERLPIWFERRRLELHARRVWAKINRRKRND
jgi:hypothetical protein